MRWLGPPTHQQDLEFHKVDSIKGRFVQAVGSQFRRSLYPIIPESFHLDCFGCQIEGVISSPKCLQACDRLLFVYINGRTVRHSPIHDLVHDVYVQCADALAHKQRTSAAAASYVASHSWPACVLNVRFDPGTTLHNDSDVAGTFRCWQKPVSCVWRILLRLISTHFPEFLAALQPGLQEQHGIVKAVMSQSNLGINFDECRTCQQQHQSSKCSKWACSDSFSDSTRTTAVAEMNQHQIDPNWYERKAAGGMGNTYDSQGTSNHIAIENERAQQPELAWHAGEHMLVEALPISAPMLSQRFGQCTGKILAEEGDADITSNKNRSRTGRNSMERKIHVNSDTEVLAPLLRKRVMLKGPAHGPASKRMNIPMQ